MDRTVVPGRVRHLAPASLSPAALGILVYAGVWAVPVVSLLWRIASGTLGKDIFEHAAAVRELATHPFDPGHPLLLADLPHTLYSPYSLALGLIVRATGIEALTVLGLAGLMNAVLLAVGLRLFVRVFTRSSAVLVLTAVFVICLWGFRPWVFSGFLNIGSLSYGLPYPSAIAIAITFMAIAAAARFLDTGEIRWPTAIGIAVAAVVVMHPYTAVFAVAGVTGLVIADSRRRQMRRYVGLLVGVGAGFIVALAWPYYPELRLFLDQVGSFDDEQSGMYDLVLPRAFPALLGFVALARRAWLVKRDPLVWTFGILAVIYAIGLATGHYTLGRMLPYMIICLQLALAIGAVDAWRRHGAHISQVVGLERVHPRAGIFVGVALFLVVAAGQVAMSGGVTFAGAEAMARLTGQYDVVIADPQSNREVPVWGGKVVSWDGALAFVDDIARRRKDTDTFFDPLSGGATRQAILARYGVQWIVYDRTAAGMTPEVEAAIGQLGESRAMSPDGRVVLLGVPR